MSGVLTENFQEDLIAIVVIYNMELDHSKTFQSLNRALKKNKQRLDLIVYDNSPNKQFHSEEFQLESFQVFYFSDANNPGVSKAYNTGFIRAEEMGKKWMLLLDQDTDFPENVFDKYLEAIQQSPKIKLFAPTLMTQHLIFSPSKYFLKRGFHLKVITPGIYDLNSIVPVNSGIMVDRIAFGKVGGYKEDVKLDFSDFQFLQRFKKHYRNFAVVDLVCQHGFSDLDLTDIEDMEKRYAYYCEGAKNSIENYSDRLILPLISLMRGLKLTLRFKSMVFIKTYLRYF